VVAVAAADVTESSSATARAIEKREDRLGGEVWWPDVKDEGCGMRNVE
jgi:hypothetical protein